MRCTIIAVGRLKSGPERELFERYHKRFDNVARGIGLGEIRFVELTESRTGSAKSRRDEEARQITSKLNEGAVVIALDERGTSMPSFEFAGMLEKLRDAGTREICFVIGGPDGLGDDVRSPARSQLSFGRLTLPHGLARIVLAEQLYRVATILAGHPYHRD
ncbi:MAG: 23S rRNA (pseudouridine(1915)-N(3))-methyltransferase RlmH [Hyphomicrobiaceae bacterium]